MYYLFDGSYAGFLCGVFESFERKEFDVIPLTHEEHQVDFFRKSRTIVTDRGKARRVQQGLEKRLEKDAAMDFFRVFLSEDRKAWLSSFNVIQRLFRHGGDILSNYGDDDVLYVAQTLKKVHRERHRMKAFVRFQKGSDGLYVAAVAPDFNVLPLISDFFRKRYADQPWLIYDVKRNYGLLYDKHSVSEVQLTPMEKRGLSVQTATITLADGDAHFQRLWKQYYTSTNIEARRNIKLHLKHVPKRYWKYLTEKGGACV